MNNKQDNNQNSKIKERFVIAHEEHLAFVLKPFGYTYHHLPFNQRYSFWKGIAVINIITVVIMSISLLILGDGIPTIIPICIGLAVLFWWYIRWYKYIKGKSNMN